MGRPSVAAVPCLLALCCCLSATLLRGASAQRPDTRPAELARLRDRAADKVPRLDDAAYGKYAEGAAPRPYALIIFFDAQELHKHRELNLQAARREFALAAAAFGKSAVAAADAAAGNASRLFFCDIEFKSAQNTFKRFEYNTVPKVRFVPPSGKSEEVDLQRFPATADGVAGFLRSKGLDVGTIERPPPISRAALGTIAAAAIISAPFVIRFLLTKKTIFHDPRWWCLTGLSIYFFSVSGGMYNIIRNMPMMMADQKNPGKAIYFYKGSGTQLGVEGFTVGGLYCVVGLLLAFATFVLPQLKPGTTQRVLMYACIGGSYLAVRQVLSLHEWKQGYWAHAYWPRRWTK